MQIPKLARRLLLFKAPDSNRDNYQAVLLIDRGNYIDEMEIHHLAVCDITGNWRAAKPRGEVTRAVLSLFVSTMYNPVTVLGAWLNRTKYPMDNYKTTKMLHQ